jgi:hypothetical protein
LTGEPRHDVPFVFGIRKAPYPEIIRSMFMLPRLKGTPPIG